MLKEIIFNVSVVFILAAFSVVCFDLHRKYKNCKKYENYYKNRVELIIFLIL